MSKNELNGKEYESPIYKLAILEAELGRTQKLLEASAKKPGWWRLCGVGVRRLWFLVVLFLSFVGCATLSDIQKSSPHLIIDSIYPAEKVANCIVEEGTQVGLNQSRLWSVGWNPLTLKKSGDNYQILVVGIQATPLAELTIKPSNTGSHIEVRAQWWISRDKFLEVVERCAKKD